MLTENEKKEYVKQANIRRRTIQPGSFKKTIGKWNEKHPNYLKDYLKEWRKKHPNYMKEWKAIHPNYMQDYLKEWRSRNKESQRQYSEIWRKKHPNYLKEWNENHPNYMQDYLKEWKRNTKRINVGSTLKIEGVDLAVVSEPDKNIYREIDELMKDELVSRRDER